MTDETRQESPQGVRRIDHEYSRSLVGILAQHRLSLLVTTYQAGKLVVIGTREGSPELTISYRNFASPMGLAIRPEGQNLVMAVDGGVCQLLNHPALAARLQPPGTYDACYLPRQAFYTGPIDAHEVVWCGDNLWVVNTLFSCLCTLDSVHNFVPRWMPPFVTALAAEDRCHLNGLAVVEDRPRYVTALGETDTREGWRPGKASGGCLIDVNSGAVVLRGLSMPHSPRARGQEIWLLESGEGRLARARPAGGTVEPVAEVPGYARGLAFAGSYAFIGLSRMRASATFAGLPIAQRETPISCGVSVVDLTIGREVARLEFHSGVEEIFDVQPMRHARNPWISGPHPSKDEVPPIWVVPEPKRA
ncbi:MAG TPA: TIGR03032 family protein [Isosphaeraceae bacterium]|nr:TIGR03032 family protein [Isosphaeraceae bacterium]